VAPGARGSLVLLLALAATQGRARAETTPAPHTKLVYFVDPEAVDCPSAEAFRAAVSTRAGHELFGEPSDLTIDVTLRRDTDAAAESYIATLGLPGASGRATRELRSTEGCGELATAAALIVSIALDPESLLRPPPAPPQPTPAPRVAARASRTWRALVGLGPRGAWGVTPDPTLGLAFSAAAVSDGVALGLELGGFLSDDAPYHTGTVSVLPFTMAFLPCALWRHVEACAVAKLGVLRGTGAGFSQNDAVTKLFGAGGARAGYIVDAGRLRFRASLEGDVVAPRTSFVVNDTSVYTTRGVSLSAGLDALLFF
jgi:hypothetical protein